MYKRNRHSRNSRGRNFGPRRGGPRRGGGFQHKSFDPRRVIGKTAAPVLEVEEIKNNFSDFKLDGRLFKNIRDHGYDTPTPIQDQAIPEILRGRDVVGVANTGTGKTGAFLIPLINKVLHRRNSRVLIIAPTRELAVQIEKELQMFSKGLNIHSVITIGGVSIGGQIKKLQRNPQFVVGTPGRLLDLEGQHKLRFQNYESIVLDEVDRMLDMGFIHDVDKIISKLPHKRQSLFFSATLDPKVHSVMSKFITNPVMISVKTADASANVAQEIIELRGRDKIQVLRELLDTADVAKALIFVRTKRSADKLHRSLMKDRFQTAVLHGNKTQNQRQRSLDEFRLGRVNILIATDVASRGIDIDDITHVINYDLPESYDAYIHRIGRTGRADKKGVALTFVG